MNLKRKFKKLVKKSPIALVFFLISFAILITFSSTNVFILASMLAIANFLGFGSYQYFTKKFKARNLQEAPSIRSGLKNFSKVDQAHQAKVFLVTGANRGLGLAFVKILTQAGHRVIATVRPDADRQKLEVLTQDILELDLANLSSVRLLGQRLTGQPIDCIVNNGVMSPDGSELGAIDIEKISKAFDTNVVGPLGVVQALLTNLMSGNDKKIVNITSDLASFSRKNHCRLYAYQSSKAALNMLNILLSKELKEKGISCFLIHPGPVKTRLNEGGTLAPEQSATAILSLLDELSIEKSGQWLDFNGETVPW